MFSNNQDLYNFIRWLVKKLEDANEIQWSLDFKKAMGISLMPGEVITAISGVLREFAKTDIPVKLNISEEVNSALLSVSSLFRD